MFDVIIKSGDIAGFIKVEGHNLIITPDIQVASKFNHLGEASGCVLAKARQVFKNDTFVISACHRNIFGNKPRNVVEEGVILNDSYFYSIDY